MRAVELSAQAPDVVSTTSPLDLIETALLWISAVAMLMAGAVLTYSVTVRHFFLWSPDWSDEASVFLLVGATFLSAPFVQSRRGHIGIEAIRGLLPPWLDRLRQVIVDMLCLVFCATFAWLCWQLFVDAFASGEVTDSSWAPPLWFPYSLVAIGMILLTLRLLIQVCVGAAQLFKPGRLAR